MPGTTEDNNITSSQYCSYRLPCGLCRLTNTQCPKQPVEIKPTWISATGTGSIITENNKEGGK